MELIIDDRECKVIPYFNNINNNIIKLTVKITVKRIYVGDYAFYYNNTLLFIIERKTWKDLSASIKDGRKENNIKLINTRNETNCKIFYLIEGKFRYGSNRKISGIPFKNLQAHLDHLIIRDNFHVIYSSSTEDSATRIFEFIKSYSSIKDLTKEILENKSNHDICKKIEKTEDTIIYNIWCCIPFVSEKTAKILIKQYHISDILLSKISKEIISEITYPNGTTIGKRAIKIINNINNNKIYIKMLNCIDGISLKTAKKIVDTFNFLDIIKGDIQLEELIEFKKTEKTKLGNKMVNEIKKFFMT